jgi:hypothetical protein
MRDFIYRIWDIKQKKYIMTASLYGGEEVTHLTQCFNRNESIIEQYTGLHDIKGNRVFEGDIVKQKIGHEYEYNAVVWNTCGWYLNEFPLSMFDDGMIVAGNIHHHSKLLKKND